jgi:Undecaprenyl-phosphate glucose phosphotransferase
MSDASETANRPFITGSAVPTPRLGPQTRSEHRIPFKAIGTAALCLDVTLIVGASVVTGVVHHLISFQQVGSVESFFGVGALTATLFAAVAMARGVYDPHAMMEFSKQLGETTKVWLLTMLVLSLSAFSLKVTDVHSRGATLAFLVVGWGTIVASRLIVARSLARKMAARGFAVQKAILIADESELNESKVVEDLRRYGYSWSRIYTFPSSLDAVKRRAYLRQTLGEIAELNREDPLSCLFILSSWIDFSTMQNALTSFRELSVPIYLLPDGAASKILKRGLVDFGATRAIELTRAPLSATEQLSKRILDCTLAGCLLILFAPLFAIIALLIKADSRGPVFFMQTRNGFNGRQFKIWKFRTMSVLEDGPFIRQATKNDPRVTTLGRVLRRTNIDELPQLFNVLAGDMSLVGPRPHASAHNSEYEKQIANYACRHHVKPGLTGWAQVQGLRGEIRTLYLMQKRVESDLWYIDNWSLWLDFRILVKTLFVGIQPTAY